MRSALLAALVLTTLPTTLFAPSSAAADGKALYAEGMDKLRNGKDTKADYDAAIASLDAAIAAGLPKADEARAHAWKGMAMLYAGDLQAKKEQKLSLYKQGEASAKKGLAKDPRCADCLYVASACLGRWGEQRGVMNSLFVVGDVLGGFEKALEIEPNHLEAQLAMGKADEALPYIAGGSTDRAEKRFRGVVQRKPNFTRAMMDLAELLEREDREQEARTWAKKVLAEKKPLFPGEHNKWDQGRARALLTRTSE